VGVGGTEVLAAARRSGGADGSLSESPSGVSRLLSSSPGLFGSLTVGWSWLGRVLNTAHLQLLGVFPKLMRSLQGRQFTVRRYLSKTRDSQVFVISRHVRDGRCRAARRPI
jgi:hypothetical protein